MTAPTEESRTKLNEVPGVPSRGGLLLGDGLAQYYQGLGPMTVDIEMLRQRYKSRDGHVRTSSSNNFG